MTRDEALTRVREIGTVEIVIHEIIGEEHQAALLGAGCRPRIVWQCPDGKMRNQNGAMKTYAPDLHAEGLQLVAMIHGEPSLSPSNPESEK